MTTTETYNGSKQAIHDSTVALKNTIQDAGKQVGASAKQVVSDIADVGSDALKTISDKGSEQLVTVEQMVKQYPIRSLMISAGVGILLSKLFK